MLNAISIYWFWGWKKKANFIIPASYFQGNIASTASATSTQKITKEIATKPEISNIQKINLDGAINALSISGLHKLKEIQERNSELKAQRQNAFLEEPFTHEDLVLQWNKFKDRIEAKGLMIVSSIMGMSPVILEGTTIKYEVPNESSKISFEGEIPSLLGHLKGHLRNHNIKIEIIVNEAIEVEKPKDKREMFIYMAEKNPVVELLRKTFDLNI